MSGSSNISIVPMEANHIEEVAGIHFNELPEDFCSLLGREFLREVLYPYVMGLEKNVGLAAVQDGKAIGYIVCASGKGFYGRLLKKYFSKVAGYGVRAAFRKPFVLIYGFLVSLILFGPKAYQFEDDEAELTYIGVAKEFQGKSIGGQLVDSMVEPLKNLGYRRCIAKTLANEKPAREFYKKNNFDLIHSAYGRVWYALNL